MFLYLYDFDGTYRSSDEEASSTRIKPSRPDSEVDLCQIETISTIPVLANPAPHHEHWNTRQCSRRNVESVKRAIQTNGKAGIAACQTLIYGKADGYPTTRTSIQKYTVTKPARQTKVTTPFPTVSDVSTVYSTITETQPDKMETVFTTEYQFTQTEIAMQKVTTGTTVTTITENVTSTTTISSPPSPTSFPHSLRQYSYDDLYNACACSNIRKPTPKIKTRTSTRKITVFTTPTSTTTKTRKTTTSTLTSSTTTTILAESTFLTTTTLPAETKTVTEPYFLTSAILTLSTTTTIEVDATSSTTITSITIVTETITPSPSPTLDSKYATCGSPMTSVTRFAPGTHAVQIIDGISNDECCRRCVDARNCVGTVSHWYAAGNTRRCSQYIRSNVYMVPISMQCPLGVAPFFLEGNVPVNAEVDHYFRGPCARAP
ncbi:hypothetical protein BJ508DRAFT_310080 [Ascobolus immersus RN42]|uniref:Uncharacterized protein n=1 Tax=Ascobolus immersus RN42 TaxID=1160509 RepID=A0A3N4I6S7_ASCIM|nr:hypothetical protein BJ508DRAFT_310080 [Ascobolus immersus RN42]